MSNDQMVLSTGVKRKRRRRRSSQEIVDNIIKAASEEFEKNGYVGATTSAIARKAGVAEPLIFSNFGSKSKLFHASIFEPMNRQLIEFNATHMADPQNTDEDRDRLRRAYIGELQDFIEEHSRKLVSLFFTQTYGDGTHSLNDIEGIQDYLNNASAMENRYDKSRKKINPRVLARISFITIFSCIIFRNWLFKDDDLGKEEVFAALTDFVLDGLNANSR